MTPASTASRDPRRPPSQEGPDRPSTEVFVYDEGDFVLRGAEWLANGGNRGTASHAVSCFDSLLQSGWRERQNRGLFRYHLGELQTQILPGRLGFVAQLNTQRGSERRKPQEIQSIQQRFDPQQFNFNKIHPEEILFCMVRGQTTSMPCMGGAQIPPGLAYVLVVINVSPLEFGHSLLIPDPTLSLPQILTPQVLRFGLDAILLSAHPGFRIGFNSLAAFASVNHLHLHGFYLNWELLVESAPCKPLLPEANLYVLEEVPAPGFLFYSEGRHMEELAHQICQVTNYLIKKEIAHNLFVTRGAIPEGPINSAARPGIRIIVWARKSCFGTKEESAFNVALCELAGHLPIKTAQDFKKLTEASAIHMLQKYLLPDFQFSQLQRELVSLLKG
ncbi:GDP-D-glucose phosphorylase 1 [Rhineura floridana]|uniref:GDP-D-glucose phosphorylase 1 n=1 Tax=Rhineura floridana TaxID=261503 RepID=UPI002AC80FE6|nr:GDP-D-glucose phosphorylase 1 [Rhineura floridana]XP_061451876.1 GDP-D-glucose phosphorylase 1 [Rhineura floridana]